MFQFRQQQFAALRRKKIGDGLIATYCDGPVRAAWSDQKNYIVLTDPLDQRTRFGFDEHGFIAAVASPMGRLWQMANYADGKAAILRNPAGHQLSIGYSSAGQLETLASDGKPRLRFHYNDQQRAIGATFSDGTFSSVEFTPWNAPWTVTNRLGQRDVCDYDEDRRLTALTDGNGHRTSFLYGAWSRPDQSLFPNETSESYLYNEKGFVTKIDTHETSVTLDPDGEGRPKCLSYSDGIEISYKYGDKGRTTEAKMSSAALDKPHVSKYSWNDSGQLEAELSGDSSVSYEYDKAGRLVGLIYPRGEKIEYGWDADSRLTSVRDWNGGEHRIEYAPNDRGSLLSSPNGVSTLILLNNLGYTENIAVSRQGTAFYSLSYVRDEEDRISSVQDSAFGYREFHYDAESQLLAADSQGDSPSENFAYDDAGNLVEASGKPAQYDPANQILSFGHSRYDYDRRGNLIRMDTVEGIWRFAWSARNLMIAVGVACGSPYHLCVRRLWAPHSEAARWPHGRFRLGRRADDRRENYHG